jgi:hypothetical protein
LRAFLIKYQDRVLYGTDTDILRQSEGKPSIANWQKQLTEDWRYFATADTSTTKDTWSGVSTFL